MSYYGGPRLKKIRHLGALPGLTRKTANPEVILKKIQFWEKGAISYSSLRKTEFVFSLSSDRTTICLNQSRVISTDFFLRFRDYFFISHLRRKIHT